MSREPAADRLRRLAERWRLRQAAADGASAAGGAAALAAVVSAAGLAPAAETRTVLAVAVAAGAAGLALGRWLRRADPLRMARHLDRVAPALEESGELLVAEAGALVPLARVQRRRAAVALEALDLGRLLPRGGGRRAALGLALVAVAAAAAGTVGAPPVGGGAVPDPAAGVPAAPGFERVEIAVEPPAYTGRPARTVAGWTVQAEEGARLEWRLRTSLPVDEVALELDGGERLELVRGADGAWRTGLEARRSRLYAAGLWRGGRRVARGELARIEVVPDREPRVEIDSPGPRTEIAARRIGALDVRVAAEDDYGVAAAELVVTLAAGRGEQVEFRDRRLALRREGDRWRATLDLAALGLGPGADLYLFAEARDVRRPVPRVGRSATHRLRVAGERAASVALGAGLPVLQIPEMFRSQRQIILDTERLVAEGDSLAPASFARRSRALGLDQRSLRMRYGALLGEEFVSGRPLEEEEGDEPSEEDYERGLEGLEEAAVPDLGELLPEGAVHEHDAAQLNTFFDDEIKALLRSALSEMWGAEGRLRGLEPERALPFEYRALRFLKRAQGRSRVYVGKSGFEATPLEPEERRLGGDLSEIRSRRERWPPPGPGEVAAARELLAVAAAPSGAEWPAAVPPSLALAVDWLAARALEDPRADLEALSIARRWLEAWPASPVPGERERLAAALWQLLPEPGPAPAAVPRPGTELLGRYLDLVEPGG